MQPNSNNKKARVATDSNPDEARRPPSAATTTSSSQPSLKSLSVGRPRYRPESASFVTGGGVVVDRLVERIPPTEIDEMFQELVGKLDDERGCVLQSAYEYPGRYSRWSLGFRNPPLVLESRGRTFKLEALNARGEVMLPWIEEKLRAECPSVSELRRESSRLARGRIKPAEGRFNEEERSKQNSIFGVIRTLISLFSTTTETDPQLGLYGSFGYDLTFQFEPIREKHFRREDDGERDLVLYLPDEILVHDVPAYRAWRLKYDFTFPGSVVTTKGVVAPEPFAKVRFNDGSELPSFASASKRRRDHEVGEYASAVERAKKEFKCGNLFECVLSQTFMEPCDKNPPSNIYSRLVENNPSPYLFFINLGEREYLVGASPEMFVRVERTSQGLRVETCPISGTIRRGKDALQDADNVYALLHSNKDKSELTMCTDVDRNDKSRVCVPGSVKVVGRRQIEAYSKLIHTVDHVEGYLREGFDALDAFLVHTWAVTVSGAPKTWAIQFIEEQEKTARRWYGGAVGLLGFDGHLNTGLTIRTVRVKDRVAEVRAGATLLWDSVPDEEEKETELKASALLEAVMGTRQLASTTTTSSSGTNGLGLLQQQEARMASAGQGKRVLLIDHDDSFVHTLANYLRQTGAEVSTIRSSVFRETDLEGPNKPNLVVMSPGPGSPRDFACGRTIGLLIKHNIPIFGVCLGLQALVEYFGGELKVLSRPVHGKPSTVRVRTDERRAGEMFAGLPETFTVARYHSLYGFKLPEELVVTATCIARGDDDVDYDENGVDGAIGHGGSDEDAGRGHPAAVVEAGRKEEDDDGADDILMSAAGAEAGGIASRHTAARREGNSSTTPIVMGVAHKTLPIWAVQFHPESILTRRENGLMILANALLGAKWT